MTGLSINTADAEAIRAGFAGAGYAQAAGKGWHAVTGLTGTIGATTGTVAAGDATVQMTDTGGGMGIFDDTPVIVSQPQGATNHVGTTVSFSVSAVSTRALTYQWYKGPTALTDRTNASLVLNNLQLSDAGTYTVAVTNSLGGLVSNPAELGVVTAPIISQPVVSNGMFQLTSSGIPGLNYTVQRSALVTGPWTNVAVVTVPGSGVFDFIDTNSLAPTRFYRIVR
jgi:hypothetical protein